MVNLDGLSPLSAAMRLLELSSKGLALTQEVEVSSWKILKKSEHAQGVAAIKRCNSGGVRFKTLLSRFEELAEANEKVHRREPFHLVLQQVKERIVGRQMEQVHQGANRAEPLRRAEEEERVAGNPAEQARYGLLGAGPYASLAQQAKYIKILKT